MRFQSRRQAGQDLAAALLQRAEGGGFADPLVLALPRGGVPVAAEIAHALHAPLDVLVVRKISAPGQPEAGVGAVVGEDPPVFDQESLVLLDMTEYQFTEAVGRQRAEIRRLEDLYREGRSAPRVQGRTVILVDDGLATGVTARAALLHLRRREPARLVLAVPVCSGLGVIRQHEADDVVCLHQPEHFYAVGEWYVDFEQLADQEVIDTLRSVPAAGG
ncbi:phosphoribosyltransferase [Streptomyces sp. HC44]|uniref:Phosphoribosyltransferase n=1 Tax=Streptomyces scabichelini TaxID=2711217 RepID=A0A6G4VJ72_9ACTN|nr:phosphoribosyltransferase family protein [Streptomyces scabichelini]NGO13827.1 phosphoribosyltransferase [Streptomyces scabichelini]